MSVLFRSETLRGDNELNPFDFMPAMGFNTGLSKVDNLVNGFIANNIIAPGIMNRAILNPFVFKSVGCKVDNHIIVRRKPLPSTIGMYPQVGVFRHEKKGLEFNSMKPINRPIMKNASSFSGVGFSTLGTPM